MKAAEDPTSCPFQGCPRSVLPLSVSRGISRALRSSQTTASKPASRCGGKPPPSLPEGAPLSPLSPLGVGVSSSALRATVSWAAGQTADRPNHFNHTGARLRPAGDLVGFLPHPGGSQSRHPRGCGWGLYPPLLTGVPPRAMFFCCRLCSSSAAGHGNVLFYVGCEWLPRSQQGNGTRWYRSPVMDDRVAFVPSDSPRTGSSVSHT
jgi:hypothetical protein